MIRLAVAAIILAVMAAAFFISNRSKPLMIDNHPTATPASAIVCHVRPVRDIPAENYGKVVRA